jgi:4-amino-4-deoxy-L-arabinose transferase-like glycosyltransferase
MLLFTLSGNILPIYVLPGIPALAVLTAKLAQRVSFSIVMTSLLTPIVLIAFLVIGLPNMSENRSDKQLLASIEPTIPVYYIGERTFSGRFYSQGRAKNVESISTLAPLKQPTYLVVTSDKVEQAQLSFVCDIKAKNKRRSLLLCKD